jgi:hypothetical protein
MRSSCRERASLVDRPGAIWQNQRVSLNVEPRCLVAIDESKRPNQPYTMIAAFIPPGEVSALRGALRRELRKNQRSLHFTKESDQVRKAVLAVLAKHRVIAVVALAHKGASKVPPREVCLRELSRVIRKAKAASVRIDRDETQERRDRKIISRELDPAGIDYSFRSRHEDELLWVADALAWSFAKGGAWRATANTLIAEIISDA